MEIVITAPAMKWSASFGFKFVNLYLLRACNFELRVMELAEFGVHCCDFPDAIARWTSGGAPVGTLLECGTNFGPA
jgi:hypothetical protein